MIDLVALKHADLPTTGSVVTNGPVKALAIQIHPQPKDDTVFVN